MAVSQFQWPDYLVFVLTLLLSSSAGVYYGIKDRGSKRSTIDNFILGGRKMNPIPVAVSLFVSWLSAISFIGDPVEVYYHGAIYWVIGIGYSVSVLPTAMYFAPAFHRMRLYSAYEGIYAGIVLYGPAVSLAQVSGIRIWVSILGMGSLCTMYTSMGGIKGVLWADTLQCIIMFIGLIAVLIRGCHVMGGFAKVWTVAKSRGRINMNNFNPNPFVRSTFWTYFLGGTFRVFCPYISQQIFIQRFSSVKTPTQASLAMYLNLPLYAVFVTMFGLLGLLMVAYFDGCDPLSAGQIEKPDQMVPLIMIELLGFLFLASVFCASLSTMSSVQNSISTNILKDIVEPLYIYKYNRPLSQRLSMHLSRLFSLLLGFIFIGMSLMLMNMEDMSIFQLTLRAMGSFTGPISAIFFLGFLVPSVDTMSAIIGGLVSFVVCVWWNIGSIMTDVGPTSRLPLTTDGCSNPNGTIHTYNTTSVMSLPTVEVSEAPNTSPSGVSDDVRPFSVTTLYQLSPLLYLPLGFAIAAVISVTVASIKRLVLRRRLEAYAVPDAANLKNQSGASKMLMDDQSADIQLT